MSTVEREVIAREEVRELKERVIEINRVAKVVKGGRRFSFTALVVIGDEVDRVGVGYGKAREVPLAISKAVDDAKKNLFTVPKHGTTVTHEILGVLRRRPSLHPARFGGNRRHRRRRRPRRARARRDPRRAGEEPGHHESDQHGQGDRAGPAEPPAPRGRREDARQDDHRGAALPRAGQGGRVAEEAPAVPAPETVEATTEVEETAS